MGYIFDPNTIERVIRDNQDGTVDEAIAGITDGLAEAYPKHIIRDLPWVLSVAGGVRGQIQLLHASITEYILIFGSPLGTEGFSGRFPADDYFWMFKGSQTMYKPGEHAITTFDSESPVNYLPRGEGFFLKFSEGAYGVEYVRGFIPGMLPFGLADAFTSTLDMRSIVETFQVYTKGVLHALRRGKI